ncbi:MAG: DUF1329 domain-containing protein [Deltaproteobacteria bacterium]|nr:DUF1329 domain-containing protein [Deltaproteobacteria bacterium]
MVNVLRVSVVVAMLGVVPAASADVSPGDTIDKSNVANVKGLISPAIEWCVNQGMTMKIIAPRPIAWPKAYKEATEKYASQVKLAENGLALQGHVAGAPFPSIDPADPKIALKIVWNYEYRPYPGTDDFVEYDFPAETGAVGNGKPMEVERYYWIGESRRMYYNSRLYVDPKPELPNPEGIRFKEVLGPLIAPFDLKGIGALEYRYVDASKQDDTWLYVPSLRRVRRLSTAQRSDALFGQDTDPDSYWGYNGHIAWSEWKFLGEKEMLGILHGEHFPQKRCEAPADYLMCDSWEKRRMWIVEGVSKLPQYAYGKRVIFIDKESLVVAYSDIYDRNSELWKVWIDNHQFRTQAFPGAPTKYDEEKDFYAGLAMVDMQLMHATYVPHPGEKPPGHEGWHFNKGSESATQYKPAGAVPDSFTVAKLIEQGQ